MNQCSHFLLQICITKLWCPFQLIFFFLLVHNLWPFSDILPQSHKSSFRGMIRDIEMLKEGCCKNLMNNPLGKKFHNNGLPKLPESYFVCFLFSYFCYYLFTWNLPQLLNPIQCMLFIPNLVKHSKCLILNNHMSVWEKFRFAIY